jgi:hypothetical protein
MTSRTLFGVAAPLGALFVAACAAQPPAMDAPPAASAAVSTPAELPLKYDAKPTTADITVDDFMSRIYVFADDSMMGRQGGTEGNMKGNAYIESEVRRLGLQPAGENGTWVQTVPLVRRQYDTTSTITVGQQTLRIWSDFAPVLARGVPRSLAGAQVVYAGVYGQAQVKPEQVAGKLVLFSAPPGAFTPLARVTATSPLFGAAGVAIANLESATPAFLATTRRSGLSLSSSGPSRLAESTVPMYVTARAAAQLLGRPIAGATPWTTGATITASTLAQVELPTPARNVVAVLPGSDPALRGQYVALGAHNDHIGVARAAVDHDSLRAWNQAKWALEGRYGGGPDLTAEQLAAIRVNLDSLRRLRPARRDSINNGADDDGSGSMALLEIAENLVASPQRPRRSVLFIWHTGEELGLVGSRYFTDNPTVPRDSIVAQINIDMIGRGTTNDIQGGGPNYLGVLGHDKLSTELGRLVAETNAAQPRPFEFDFRLNAPGHPEQIYCRSDHWNYARYNIPIAFFFTNLHEDYHQVTDEPQYIDYPHLTRITQYMRDLTLRTANLDHRPAVDGPRMANPQQPCVQ